MIRRKPEATCRSDLTIQTPAEFWQILAQIAELKSQISDLTFDLRNLRSEI